MNTDSLSHSSNGSETPAAVPSFTDPKVKRRLRDELRAAEWAMHRRLMAAAETALDNFLSNPHRITAQDVARLTELGLELGRSACGLPQPDETAPRGPFINIEFRNALEKIYGEPVPAKFIDTESEIKALPPAPTDSPPASI